MKPTREQLYAKLSKQYRDKWLKQNKTNAQVFAEKIGLSEPFTWQDIDNGKDITDYSDSSGGEVIVK